jgi:hypothetical protein
VQRQAAATAASGPVKVMEDIRRLRDAVGVIVSILEASFINFYGLVGGMGEMVFFFDNVTDQTQVVPLKGMFLEMLRLTEDESRFVVEYKLDGAARTNKDPANLIFLTCSVIKYARLMRSYRQMPRIFPKSFKDLKGRFDRGMGV